MFFEVALKQMVLLKPQELGEGVFFQKNLICRLLENVGKVPCTEEHGYIVTVNNIKSITDGIIRADTGSVVFWVEFNAIVLDLHKGEVLDVEVDSVGERGCHCDAGPIRVFLPAAQMPDFEYKPGVDNFYHAFKGRDGAEITKGSIIRVLIYAKVWKREERNHGYAGTLARHFLGLVPDFAADNLQSREGDEALAADGPAAADEDGDVPMAAAEDVHVPMAAAEDVLMPDATCPEHDTLTEAGSKGSPAAPPPGGEEEPLKGGAGSEGKHVADSEDKVEAGSEDQPADSTPAASPSPTPATENSKTGRGRATRFKGTRVVCSDEEDNVVPKKQQQRGRPPVVNLSDSE